ncbi:MAG: cysteine--tRNA ligase [Oscillospiraceae bacterium]|nr:cysteine--tRNA ligase [Oscillospiraceae bacterium]
MKIYNTLTGQKEEFKPIQEGKAGIYVCGPTVYNYIHIGNARPICVFDVFRRYLEFKGMDVKFIQNYTDVNDKIIKQAELENSTPEETALKYIREYETDTKGLNVRGADIHPKVSEYMDKIIDMIKTLVEKGYAYESNGDVYYRTRKFDGYGKLSKQSIDDLIAGARVEVNDIKEDPLDFALWKSAGEDEQHWESPWGKGRPGWHIECSAMAKDCIGDTIDIHCGGKDLVFPHHENEIAQSEAATGKIFANYWMHNGHITIDNKKMSKSAGTFFLTRDAAAKYGYETIRYLMIQAHYRMPMNYTAELLESCKASLERLYNCRENLDKAIARAKDGEITAQANEIFEKRMQQFIDVMDDDLNTADGLTAVFELVRDLNIMIADENTSKQQLLKGAEIFDKLTGVLGILYNRKQEEEIPSEVMELVQQRQEARKAKDFALADEIRDKIAALGYTVKETRQGTEITKN